MHFGNDGDPGCEGTTSGYGECGSRSTAHRAGVFARMIGLPVGTKIWIAAGVTDLRRGFTGLSGMVETALEENPFSGQGVGFRGRGGGLSQKLWVGGGGVWF